MTSEKHKKIYDKLLDIIENQTPDEGIDYYCQALISLFGAFAQAAFCSHDIDPTKVSPEVMRESFIKFIDMNESFFKAAVEKLKATKSIEFINSARDKKEVH